MGLDDLSRFHDVSGPQVSPDGQWIAYSVSTIEPTADKRVSDLWMVSRDGKQDIRLTWAGAADQASEDFSSAGSPRWSPDGQYLSFTSGRPGPAKGSQVWILDRRGGEAQQLTNVKGHLSAYAWSPDSKRLLLSITPEEDDNSGSNKPAADKSADKEKEKPKPIVIDRYHFKEDVEGYLRDNEHTQLYLWDIASKKLEKLTTDKNYDESNAVWSPDGTRIAYVSNHDPDPDRSINTDVWVVDAKANSSPRRLTTYDGPDGGRISWSPDGMWIAFTEGDPLKLWQYSEEKLGIVAADGSTAPRILTAALDRSVSSPFFSPGGKSIDVLVEDDRNEYPASVDIASGQVHRILSSPGTAMGLDEVNGHTALVWTTNAQPGEIYTLENGTLDQLTHHNDEVVASLKLGETRDVQATTQDGTEVHGLITLPPGAQAGAKLPMLLFIHGGPNGQDAHRFDLTRQMFAGHGYAVLNVNYRGSSGRGSAYQRIIADDWGDHEIQDLLASVDAMVKEGIADPDKLAVGGWSYGGILTNYTIASTNRFKAASSGAGMGNPLGLYGIDEYILQYNNELGPPWKDLSTYVKLGYPLLHADRIHTPTLYMGGTSDMNVPLNGGEQMYEALKTLNVPAELVVYPNQFHGFTRPSFIRDRYQRWFDWYDKWVLGKTAAAAPAVH
ncbi:MAG TPA: S9 family peptidase [Acidobacteriaceae bacterium]|jgi:dipeptidyl aminopeptidase/acylaminoacyl peptidase|nr:S9 family peptidase [Acidobacteriaceae bacterium]